MTISRLITAILCTAFLYACNNRPTPIPFPAELATYAQPAVQQLTIAATKKIQWDTIKKGDITFSSRPLNIDLLPSTSYDTAGFSTFSKKPITTKLSLNSLPQKALNFAAIPSQSLNLITKVLPPLVRTRVSLPNEQPGKNFSLYDLGPTQGFPNKIVSGVFKDSHGFLWVSGFEGLNRYNGSFTETIIQGPNNIFISGITEDKMGRIWYISSAEIGVIDLQKSTISTSKQVTAVENNINDMFTDGQGRLWVQNAKQKGLSVIDPQTLSFKTITTSNGLLDANTFNVDQDNNQRIWVSTYTKGVHIFDFANNTISYLSTNNGLSTDRITALAKRANGQIFINCNNGNIDAYDPQLQTLTNYPNATPASISYYFFLRFDKKGNLWRGSTASLEKIDLAKNEKRSFSNSNGLAAGGAVSFAADNYGRLWVGSLRGLNMIDFYGETIKILSNYNISSTSEDEAENIWVGTINGLFIINRNLKTIKSLGQANGLLNNFIQSVRRDGSKMYVTSNGGLNIIDLSNKTLKSFGKNEGLAADTMYNVLLDDRERYWMAGPSGGISVIDMPNKLVLSVATKGGLSQNNVQDIKKDDDGNIWIITLSKGLNIINPRQNTIQYIDQPAGLRDSSSKVLLPANKGGMWVGTGRGVYLADWPNKNILEFGRQQGTSGAAVLSLSPYDNQVVAGLTNKINIITPPVGTDSLWHVAVLNKSEKIQKQTQSWQTDHITKNGMYLWGDAGLTILPSIQPAIDSSRALVSGFSLMTVQQSFWKAPALSGSDTLYANDTFYTAGSKINIPGYVKNKRITWDSVAGSFNLPINLSIPHNQNFIQFQFAQTNPGRLDTTLYSYVLEGVDKKWSNPDINTFSENYINLPPGQYVFRVSSKGIDGRWSEPDSFSFTVAPPWYQTWWAYLLFLLVGAVLLRTYVVYRQRKLKEENRILEDKIQLRTNELQESLKNLKAAQDQLIYAEKMASLGELTAGIAHEIQNPLNFINNFSEINQELLGEMNDAIEQNNLTELKVLVADLNANEAKINHHGKRADSIVKGMLQHSRVTSGTKDPVNINALADEYLRLSYHGLRAKDKSFNAKFEMNFDDNIKTINAVGQDLGRVLLNLFNNAFYAVADKRKNLLAQENLNGYEPEVSVTTKKTGNSVVLTIRDNGNGIPQKLLDKIFQPFFTTKPTGQGTGLGLSLSYDIIKAHGGEIKVKTNEGEGTAFEIKLPA